jgi:hypothetical protein
MFNWQTFGSWPTKVRGNKNWKTRPSKNTKANRFIGRSVKPDDFIFKMCSKSSGRNRTAQAMSAIMHQVKTTEDKRRF